MVWKSNTFNPHFAQTSSFHKSWSIQEKANRSPLGAHAGCVKFGFCAVKSVSPRPSVDGQHEVVGLTPRIEGILAETEQISAYREKLLQGVEQAFSMRNPIESVHTEEPIRKAGFRQAIMKRYFSIILEKVKILSFTT